MQITVLSKPILLYEALELAIACIHKIPPEQLTAPEPYCIPASAISELLHRAAPLLPNGNWEIQFYFGRHAVANAAGRPVTLASTLLYAFIYLSDHSIEEMLQRMAEDWQTLRQGSFHILNVNGYTLEFVPQPGTERTLLSQELAPLKLPMDYKLSLLECFSDFSYHLHQIYNILKPVIALLEPFLAPYAEAAAPLRKQWYDFGHQMELEEFLFRRVQIVSDEGLQSLCIALRYLDCRGGPGQTDSFRKIAWFHIGTKIHVGLPSFKSEDIPADALRALRLLGDRSRAELIHTLGSDIRTMQDLALELQQNPGTVFKNLNTLIDANILYNEHRNGRKYYRVNHENLRNILSIAQNYLLSPKE